MLPDTHVVLAVDDRERGGRRRYSLGDLLGQELGRERVRGDAPDEPHREQPLAPDRLVVLVREAPLDEVRYGFGGRRPRRLVRRDGVLIVEHVAERLYVLQRRVDALPQIRGKGVDRVAD